MEGLEDIQSKAVKQIICEMKEIYEIWNEIGLNTFQKEERVKTAWDHIHALVRDIKNEEICICEEIKGNVRCLTEKVSELSQTLSVEATPVAGLTYYQRLEKLQQDYDRFNDLKEQRMKDVKNLRIIEQSYCKLLDVEEYKFSSNTNIPSEADLKELQQHINMLIDEHNKRYEMYCQAKQQLSTILEETDGTPYGTLEKHICSEKEPISLSKTTFQEIEEIIARAKKRKEELESKKKILTDRLKLLWNRLNIDNDIKIEFMSNHVNCKASTLAAIKSEINKYEEMKNQNLILYIGSARKELTELWDKCGASNSEKNMFDPYFSEDVTEGVLIIHEEEIERWKKYYEEVCHILEKIEKRNKLWELLKAQDNKVNDPNRFKNRGGNLLKEERERNKLLRTLPTLEQEINEDIEKYEAEKRRKFFYLGEDYRIVIINQWGQRMSCKENLKQENHLTPAKRFPFNTPKKSPAPRFAIYRSGLTPKSNSKVKRAVQKRELDVLKEVGSKLNENPTCSNATTYPDFELDLNNAARKSLRSSAIASKKIGGTRSPMHSKKRRSSPKKRSIIVEEEF
ncbi:protein regulator of cytokinesis 1 [Parasteatoda tepidariorum]|uniref:protein regulator of cytokinesis 1 n=1 Tax=Parasteatoda tepidariorum TaxID=114398 RepID=UPI001C71F585|nr:protein regulator of cytokinesis 1 [Parasteatoda tepidariorum]XP_015914125.2 protein regulator of cytokinesis 1 [Parasteatoda tepidariorum]XP_042895209.1 protein regulator of cytokinesis 1 [Parasteatoda tepidariorum]